MLSKGQGCEQDQAKAFSWCQKAAEQGVAEAQIALGDAYGTGRGVAPDHDAARRWYEAAARQGNELAAAKLKQLVAQSVGQQAAVPVT